MCERLSLCEKAVIRFLSFVEKKDIGTSKSLKMLLSSEA